MKAIKHQATISTITAKVDGSIGYKVNTPELTKEEKNAIFDLQNQNVEIVVCPIGSKEVLEVTSELDRKTPSQRLRGSLYVLLEKKLHRKPEKMEWEDFYTTSMEKIIVNIQKQMEAYE